MIGHMRHGSPPRLKALQCILSPNRRESLPTPSAGVRIRSLFRKVGVGGRRYIREDCRLGSRDSSLGPPLKLAATRLVSGDLLVVATNTDPKIALDRLGPLPAVVGDRNALRGHQDAGLQFRVYPPHSPRPDRQASRCVGRGFCVRPRDWRMAGETPN